MKVEISNEHLDVLVKEALMQAYDDCIILPPYGKPEEDNEFLYCLKRVIEHYSAPEDYAEWLKRVEE